MMIDPQYLTTTNDFKPLFVHISLSIYLLYDFYIQLSEENKLHIITYGISPNLFFKSFVFFIIVHLSNLGEVLQYHKLSLREPLEPNHSSNAVVKIRHTNKVLVLYTWQGTLPTIQLISSSLTLSPSFSPFSQISLHLLNYITIHFKLKSAQQTSCFLHISSGAFRYQQMADFEIHNVHKIHKLTGILSL